MRSWSVILKEFAVFKQQGGDFLFIGKIAAYNANGAIAAAKIRFPLVRHPAVKGKESHANSYE